MITYHLPIALLIIIHLIINHGRQKTITRTQLKGIVFRFPYILREDIKKPKIFISLN